MSNIQVFPESGHHYTFLDFEPEVLKTYPTLRKLCEEERVPWTPITHSWLRGRFGMNEGQHGMWVAMESNLGDIRRGSIYEPLRDYHEAEAGQHDTQNPSPYAASDAARLPDDVEVISIDLPLGGQNVTVARLEVIWKKPAGEPREVDLIVDFGNTRTVVLALEHNLAQTGNLSTVCHAIRFTKRGADYTEFQGHKQDDSCSIVDSWFILHEPMFADFEPPRSSFTPTTEIHRSEERVKEGFFGKEQIRVTHTGTKRVPQMFVELSPVVMGDSAREILANLNLDEGGNYTLSSPKRFAWDKDSLDVEHREWWTMAHNRWNPQSRRPTSLPKLQGAMLRFLPLDGRDWDIDAPPHEAVDYAQRPTSAPDRPSYPRADAMTWSALGIIELAHRQITSQEWRRANGEFIPRRLSRVLVTFPSGWSTQEIADYKAKWQKALNIFAITHLKDKRLNSEGGDRPELIMDLDEAVASQLPIIYSEIRRLDNKGENWIELFGHGEGTDSRVRVMTVDIGGGTTDISIIEYRDQLEGRGVELEAKLLFRDSSTTAGDALAKEIIEAVLLPALGARFVGQDQQMEIFEDVFKSAHKKAAHQARWSRIVKLVFMPIIRQWLKDLSEGRDVSADGTSWSPDRIMGAEGRIVDSRSLQELNDLCREAGLDVDVMPEQDPIFHDVDRLRGCINQVFRPLVQSLAKYVTAFGVDLVTLSGKPSELPQVKQILEDYLPILPQRVLQAKNYPAGEWYPMSSNNCISDAKTVTAVGAALYQAIKHGLVSDWSIKSVNNGQPFNYHWGAMPGKAMPWKFDPPYLNPDLKTEAPEGKWPGINRVTVPMQVGTRIGRKILLSAAKPEQVYRLRWKDRAKATASGLPLNVTVVVTLERNADDATRLRMVSCKARNEGQDLEKTGGLELQLCTLEDEDFWVDSGRFHVAWPETMHP